MKTIERLRELLDRCNFGTTKVERLEGDMEVGMPDRFDVIAENGDAIAAMYLCEQSRCEDGAALLSDSHNALPALLAVVEAQAVEIEAWRAVHAASCNASRIGKIHGGRGALLEEAMKDAHACVAVAKDAMKSTDTALRALEGGAG